MAPPRRKATVSKNNVGTQTEAPCTCKRKTAKKNAEVQTEVPKQHASVQVTGCDECQSLALAVPGDGGSTCVRCDQLKDLLCLVVNLKEEVERLRTIKECEREIDWWCQSLSAPRSWHTAEALRGACHSLPPCKQVVEGNRQVDCVPAAVQGNLRAEQGNLREEEEWKRIPARRSGRPPSRPSSAPQVPLQNRFEALNLEGEVSEGVEGGPPVRLPRAKRSTPRLKTASARKDRRVVVIGDSLLRGTEGPICRPDPTRREVCCLPGARVRDIARKLPGLIGPSDYYPLLIVQAGSDEVAERSLRSIKEDFRGLGRVVEGTGVQVDFSSLPSVAGKDTESIQKTRLINKWLRSWCKHRNFGFFDHGVIYSAPGMMAADGSSLSPRGKRILAQELAGLIERCLN